MILIPLQSGSNGNALYVEAKGVRLLIDAGVSGSVVKERLAAFGKSADRIDGLFVSHEHSDHIRCAGIYARMFQAPVHITRRTYAVAKRRAKLGEIADVRHFQAGESVTVGPVTVHTVPTPHDAVDGSVFVVDDGECRLGICTDLGHVFSDLTSLVGSVDGLYLESNYDEDMLERGPYPMALKRRIAGPGGHISNADAAELLAWGATDRLKWLCLAHLSAENNRPELALAAHRQALGHALPIVVAERYAATRPLTLGGQSPDSCLPSAARETIPYDEEPLGSPGALAFPGPAR